MGKLSNSDLQKLLQCIKKDDRVLVPPTIGFDAGVHRLGDSYVVVATDPCTGVPMNWFGWLLINYAASDVALFGAKPEFCTINLLGPRPTSPAIFQKIMEQTCKATDELGIAIVRGHTGMYDSLKDMLGVCTVYGTVKPEKLITPAKVQAGDLILCTQPLGHETVVNFCRAQKKLAQKLLGESRQSELLTMVHAQSCVREAMALADAGVVHAMHDATEGGFVAALNELADASGLGFWVDWNAIPILPDISILKKHFRLSNDQVLSMSSTGTILAAIAPEAKDTAIKILRERHLSPAVIGEFRNQEKRVLIKEEKSLAFPAVANDPYTMMLSKSTF